MILRPYQAEGVAAIREAFRAHKAVIYQAPTGSGKTTIFVYIADGAVQKGKRVWILAHRQELIVQISRALDDQQVPHGIAAAGFPALPIMPVQVCSVMSLTRRHAKLPPPDLIVIDEAHHSPAGSWRAILDAYPSARILGVTATPLRLDGKGLGVSNGGHFQALISGPSVASLIAAGFLAKPSIYVPPSSLDLSGVKTQAGDYVKGALEEVVDKPIITGSAVEHYLKLCPRAPAIAFCAGIEHAEHVTEQFRAAGISWGLLVGAPAMSDAERKAAVRNLRGFIWRGVSTVDLVSEGFDVPIVEAAILLRPTQSLGLYLQQVGRVLRPSPGKERAIILDHVGNVERHLPPQVEREWTLDGLKPSAAATEEATQQYRQCPACYLYHEWAATCPSCGHVYAAKPRAPLAQRDGELKELTPEEIERMRISKQRRIEEGRAQTLKELKALGNARGYKSGWAQHRWEARQRRFG